MTSHPYITDREDLSVQDQCPQRSGVSQKSNHRNDQLHLLEDTCPLSITLITLFDIGDSCRRNK